MENNINLRLVSKKAKCKEKYIFPDFEVSHYFAYELKPIAAAVMLLPNWGGKRFPSFYFFLIT